MKILDIFKQQTYNIGFVIPTETMFSQGIKENEIIWMKHTYKDRFFADPFLLKEDMYNMYILCEEFVFYERVGKIVSLTVDKISYELKKRTVLIKENYHLSFPFCELNGEWIIPEASWSGESFAYQINLDTIEIKKKILIAEEGLIDNIFYKDQDGTIWMYAGRQCDENEAIYVYKLDEKKCFQKYSAMPVETRSDCSRSAGRIFEYKGKMYRPVQDCSQIYGKQTKIMEIVSIGKEGYEVTECCVLNSFLNPIYNETMHTFNLYNNIILVDGSRNFYRFRNLFYSRVCVRIWSYIKKYCMQ